MTHEHDDQLQRLAELLKTTQIEPDDPMRRLAEALVPDDSYSHQQAERDLPLYVTDEMLDLPAPRRFPELDRHLLTCEKCAALHLAMLTDMVEEPAPIAVPPSDLSFLPGAYFRRLRSATLRLAQGIAAALFPDSLPALADVADLLLDELQDRGPDLRAAPGHSAFFAMTGGDLPDEVRVLAATWTATRKLGESLGVDEMVRLQQTGVWAEMARRAAAQAAADLGFPRRQADRFAQAYAGLVAADPTAIPARTTLDVRS